MIPPRRAATIEIAIPVARRGVGKTSVIRQSKAAFPQLITPLKIAETMRLWCLLYTKYNPIEQSPDESVLNTANKYLFELNLYLFILFLQQRIY